MEIKSFFAESAIEAVSRIREELGSDAVVLDIRQIKPSGISRFLNKPKIEVLAYKPTKKAEDKSEIEELRKELFSIKSLIEEKMRAMATVEKADSVIPQYHGSSAEDDVLISQQDWRVVFLQRLGIEPLFVRALIDELYGNEEIDVEPSSSQIKRLFNFLKKKYIEPEERNITNGVHIFIGAPGCGKTTVLCKLLARLVLIQSKSAQVLQMDGVVANISQLPSLYSEILGVPYTRNYTEISTLGTEYVMVDIPGVDWRSKLSIEKLGEVIGEFQNPVVHLVLNLSYETRLLMEQVKSFSKIGFNDLIFTHTDEGAVKGKIFNFILGTNYTVGFLSGGQNIPGELYQGSFDTIFKGVFPQE